MWGAARAVGLRPRHRSGGVDGGRRPCGTPFLRGGRAVRRPSSAGRRGWPACVCGRRSARVALPDRLPRPAGGVLDDGRARRRLRRAPVHARRAAGRRSAVFPSTCFTFAILLGWGLGPGGARCRPLAVIVSGCADAARRPGGRRSTSAQYALRPRRRGGGDPARLGATAFRAGARLDWTDVLAVGRPPRGLVRRQLRVGQRARCGCASAAVVAGRPARARLRAALHRLAAAARPGAGRGGAGQRRADPAGAGAALRGLPDGAALRRAGAAGRALDPLTGLANRKALLAEVAEQLHRARRAGGQGGTRTRSSRCCCSTSTGSSTSTTRSGHAVGDRLLVEVGGPAQPTVTRAAGRGRPARRRRVRHPRHPAARRRRRPRAAPTEVVGRAGRAGRARRAAAGRRRRRSASRSIPEHGEDFATLMRHADVAMYDAKHRGDTVAVYAPESDHNSPERLGLLADLRRVLETSAPVLGGPATATPATNAPATSGSAATVPAIDATATGGPVAGTGLPELTANVPGAAELDLAASTAGAERGATGLADSVTAVPVTVPGLPPAVASVLATPLGAAKGRPGADVQGVRTVPGPPARRRHHRVERPAAGPAGRGGPRPAGERRPRACRPAVTPARSPCTTSRRSPSRPARWSGVEALLRWQHPRAGVGRPGGADPGRRAQRGDAAAHPPGDRRRGRRSSPSGRRPGSRLRAAVNVSVRDLHTGEIADQIADAAGRARGSRPSGCSWRSPRAR